MFGGLIGGAISIIGGIVNRNDKKKEQERAQDRYEKAEQQEVDKFENLRERAGKAGFNPLTALENGGLQNSFASYGAPPLASVDMIVGGLRDVADYFTKDDDDAKAREALEQDLLRAQIDELRLRPHAAEAIVGTLPRLGSAHTTDITGSTRVVMPKERTSGQAFGTNVPVNTGFSDADVWSTRYGEVGEVIGGALNLGADIGSGLRYAFGMRPASEVNYRLPSMDRTFTDAPIKTPKFVPANQRWNMYHN